MRHATCNSVRPVPQLPVRTILVAALALVSCAPPTSFAASPMQPGLWEMRVTATVNRATQPAALTRECLSQADIDHETKTLPRPDGNCTLSNITTSGNKLSYDLVCKRDEFTNQGRMELVVGSQSYDGLADLRISAPGKNDTPMTVMVNAKRVGDCTK